MNCPICGLTVGNGPDHCPHIGHDEDEEAQEDPTSLGAALKDEIASLPAPGQRTTFYKKHTITVYPVKWSRRNGVRTVPRWYAVMVEGTKHKDAGFSSIKHATDTAKGWIDHDEESAAKKSEEKRPSD